MGINKGYIGIILGLHGDYSGIMDKKMESTIVYNVYLGVILGQLGAPQLVHHPHQEVLCRVVSLHEFEGVLAAEDSWLGPGTVWAWMLW